VSYHLEFSKQVNSEIDFHKKSGNRALLKKIFVLLDELADHPYEGAGKPEPLKHSLTGC